MRHSDCYLRCGRLGCHQMRQTRMVLCNKTPLSSVVVNTQGRESGGSWFETCPGAWYPRRRPCGVAIHTLDYIINWLGKCRIRAKKCRIRAKKPPLGVALAACGQRAGGGGGRFAGSAAHPPPHTHRAARATPSAPRPSLTRTRPPGRAARVARRSSGLPGQDAGAARVVRCVGLRVNDSESVECRRAAAATRRGPPASQAEP